MATNSLISDQPDPKKMTGDVWLLVLKDMEDRRQHGIDKYGTPLQVNNGRDALIDLYQEILDAAVYARQAIEEKRLGISLLLELERCIYGELDFTKWRDANEGRDALRQVLEWIEKLKRGESLL